MVGPLYFHYAFTPAYLEMQPSPALQRFNSSKGDAHRYGVLPLQGGVQMHKNYPECSIHSMPTASSARKCGFL